MLVLNIAGNLSAENANCPSNALTKIFISKYKYYGSQHRTKSLWNDLYPEVLTLNLFQNRK